ncbi:hypothetical protein DK37_02970 [Halomonas sp. SUBG004]|nr:hypothetical protein DK37_02970 [Halomonas sp. SUBG004]
MKHKDAGGLLAQTLRLATKADHRCIDHHPALVTLLSPHLDRARFGRGLAALYPAIAGLEFTLDQSPVDGEARYPLTLREPLLRQDLVGLNQPQQSAWPFTAPANAYEKVGMMYVLEGSRLGGQLIGRHVRRLLGEQVPCRFFTDVPLTPHAWAAFWHYAEAMCPESTWPDVVMGARQAFGEFNQALTAALHADDAITPALAPIE